ncbi:MAG: hypothetical protein IH597_09450 [Bacteroidales bacterium]|nr:hypothetical protein [Bacteroidales bacterium]
MAVTITYNKLFEVKILHHFFLNKGETVFDSMTDEDKALTMLQYDVRDFFDIYPSPECQKTLNAHNCVFKATSQGIIIGVRAESDDQNPPTLSLFNPFDDDQVFTFVIQLKDMGFMNYTALPFIGNSGKMYVFRNLTSGSSRSFPSISSNPPVYEADTEYYPGDMLGNHPDNLTTLFTALNKTTNPVTNSVDWMIETLADNVPLAYVNINDQHSVVRGMLLYKVSETDVTPSITVKTAAGVTITPEINILAGEYRTVQVDMRGFPDGFYTIHFESADPIYDDDIAFYLFQQRSNPFGIINLTLHSDSPDYSMIDGNGFLRSPEYELRFRNRRTYWRYVGKVFNANSVTEKPLPLTRYGVITNVTVKDKDGADIEDLPNPGYAPVKTEALSKPAENKYYSEIHIN